MDLLPSKKIPLAQHSLYEMEIWLSQIGAKRRKGEKSLWILIKPLWTAKIRMEQDGLKVIWSKVEKENQIFCSYGLARRDIEDVILHGP
tara:strand:- start:579 stop:845 length:267 start_codon:yes stop_codon:yes gene_type:complete